MGLQESNFQVWTGKNVLLVLTMLASGTGQWYFQSIQPTWAIPLDVQGSSEDYGLDLIHLPMPEIMTESSQSLNIHGSKLTDTEELISIDTSVRDLNITTYQTNIEPESISSKGLNNLDTSHIKPNRDKIKQRQIQASVNSKKSDYNTRSKDKKGQIGEILSSSSQLISQLNESNNEDAESPPTPMRQIPEGDETPLGINEEQELKLRVRPRPIEEIPPLPKKKDRKKFKPIGYLRGYAGYFHTSNIFSSNDDKIEDGLFYTGLTLASAYFSVSPNTYVNGSINGGLIRYVDQSKFDYNRLRLNLGIYQQLSREMYAELDFYNQQLYYHNDGDFFAAGERFLNEDSVRLSLDRKDNLNKKLSLRSRYELSARFSQPTRRSRVVNSLRLSLNYALKKPLNVGINYRFSLSDFTERDREDKFHRLFAHLNYRTSNTSNIYFQGGVNLGDSTNPNVDFSGWFFSVSYGFELGRF